MSATVQNGGWGHSPGRLLLWAVPTALLIIPAVMMLTAAEGWHWEPFDFVIAAAVLYGMTGIVDLAIRSSGSRAYRFGAGLAVLVSFLLLWINGAVGVIGDENNPANVVFVGVILLAAAGSALARFRPAGMARAMLLACAFTAAIAVAAPVFGWGADEPPGTAGLTMLISGFALMWGVSAALFARAAQTSEGDVT